MIKINSLETRGPSKWALRRKKAAHVFQKAYREKTSTIIAPAVTRSGSTLDVRSQIPCRISSLVFFAKNYRRVTPAIKWQRSKVICAGISLLRRFRERF